MATRGSSRREPSSESSAASSSNPSTPAASEPSPEPSIATGSRRSFVRGAFGMCALIGLGGVGLLPNKPLCRPPGGQDEAHLLHTCIHCERCREVCPTAAIGVTHIEDGILGARTPRMSFRRGWCDFCEDGPSGPRCVVVCPTGALALREGEVPVLGTAVLNREWCLASKGMGCSSCVDACRYEAMSVGADGVPLVDDAACNGCGACEFACISLSAGSLTVGATDKAIVVEPPHEQGSAAS